MRRGQAYNWQKNILAVWYDIPVAIVAQSRSLIRHKEEPGLSEGKARIFNCSSPDITPPKPSVLSYRDGAFLYFPSGWMRLYIFFKLRQCLRLLISKANWKYKWLFTVRRRRLCRRVTARS